MWVRTHQSENLKTFRSLFAVISEMNQTWKFRFLPVVYILLVFQMWYWTQGVSVLTSLCGTFRLFSCKANKLIFSPLAARVHIFNTHTTNKATWLSESAVTMISTFAVIINRCFFALIWCIAKLQLNSHCKMKHDVSHPCCWPHRPALYRRRQRVPLAAKHLPERWHLHQPDGQLCLRVC